MPPFYIHTHSPLSLIKYEKILMEHRKIAEKKIQQNDCQQMSGLWDNA